MLRVDDVSLRFGGIHALREVSFEVEPGAAFGLIGPNGAGKTAMLNCVCGVYRPQSGRITFAGETLAGRRPEAISALGIGRTFQSMDHFEDFRVLDYVLLGRSRHLSASTLLPALRWPSVIRREREQERAALAILEECGLLGVARERLAEIPYGTQKLVDLARIMASEAGWVLLDEPTSGTTSSERPAISAALRSLRDRRTTVVIVDHDVDFVSRHADRLVALDQGQVIAHGKTREVMEDPTVQQIYLGLVREGDLAV
ncbi:ATP-binding cassette domain-containing protein [Streptosporangium sp. NPDC006013]|uniref:ABC transporter ATP-binding protein n=1 Tax=Streptosporangium sp. NPDC006013 TaxID=3155596 RepID=UPI0033B11F44